MRSILSSGLLMQKNHGVRDRKLKYIITYLDPTHLPLVMALQEHILQNLGRRDLLQPFSSNFMKKHMGRRGVVLGVFVENCLAAFRNVYYPEPCDSEWNLGLDLGMAEEELTKVANLQMVCVHPRFRGNGLALKMNRISLGLLRESGVRHQVCATVSPYNIWNIPVLLESGFHIAKLKSKYGGKLRYIVHQDLRRPLMFNDSSAVKVRLDDFETQKRWFDLGFSGVALDKRKSRCRDNPAGSFNLVFKKPLKKNLVPFDLAMPSCLEWPEETAVAASIRP
jgi:hypothetical protein